MTQDEIMKYAPYIAIGFFALLAIIIIPVVLRKTRKKQKEAANFFPELANKTGLVINNDVLTGNYKGFDVRFGYRLGNNLRASYQTLTGNSNAHGANAIYPTVHVEVITPNNMPAMAIYEKPGLFSHTNQRIQDVLTGRDPKYPKIADADNLRKNLDIYGTDAAAAQKIMDSAALKQLLSNWKYTDIRTEGNNLKLTLDNNSVNATIGIQKMYTHEFAIQALDIAVEAARALN
ncbi:MAG TPA: hypothetical protein VD905_18125 [Flavobacteriales bacterium]|nr:hypothetical protein [Flavobacteriales bacterium]